MLSVGFAELSGIPFCKVSKVTRMSSLLTDCDGTEFGNFILRIGGAMRFIFLGF